jgi:hypothetical protein
MRQDLRGLHQNLDSVTISNMSQALPRRTRMKPNQSGQSNILLIPLVLAIVLLLGAASFGVWAYSSRQDYKFNSDQKVAAAVKVAVGDEGIRKDKEHAEADKQPLKAYDGPAPYGSVHVMYPKTWSAYVDDISSDPPLNGYFHPGVVPSINTPKTGFALRVRVTNESYTQVVEKYTDRVSEGTVKSVPYAFPKRPNIVGIRLDGAFDEEIKFTGTIIIVPLRDKTLEVWNETTTYSADFANNILPNITFNP